MFLPPVEPLKDPAFLARVRTEEIYRPYLAWQREAYAECAEGVPPLPRSLRDVFCETGAREDFEIPFFRRRHFLTASALFSLLYPEEGRYLAGLEEVLSAILGEWSWAASPHTAGMGEDGKTFIDLFAAELGLAISEILYLLGDRLDPALARRAEAEVKRRVISSYEKRRFWWEDAPMNWSMVCAGNVAGAMMYLDPAAFARQKARLKRSVDCFLGGFSDDGVCLEGLGYWQYGVGNFLVFADLSEKFSPGEEELLSRGKVKKIAAYPLLCLMRGDTFPTVADTPSHDILLNRGYFHYLARRLRLPLPPERLLGLYRGNVSWNELTRGLLWTDPVQERDPLPLRDVRFPAAGQAIFNRPHYSLFVKGGTNAEPHNHNDVGSFILSTEEGQVLCDIGAGRYVNGYFDDASRYNFLCNSSRGHSVPIVNGAFQRAGERFCGTLSEDGLSVEFSAAYGQAGFTKLLRTFRCGDGFVSMTDEFSAGAEITERFVSLKEPVRDGDGVRIGNMRIVCGSGIRPDISSERHELHGFVFDNESGNRGAISVWLIDYALPRGTDRISFRFTL